MNEVKDTSLVKVSIQFEGVSPTQLAEIHRATDEFVTVAVAVPTDARIYRDTPPPGERVPVMRVTAAQKDQIYPRYKVRVELATEFTGDWWRENLRPGESNRCAVKPSRRGLICLLDILDILDNEEEQQAA